MKKSLIKNLLDRRFPQIVGSYFVGATSLLLFLDWLVVKYHLSDFITSLALFGVISIIPTVVILAYFHGAPGKDEWTRVERYGIPANIIFIAIALFVGNKYNLWEDAPPDHSKVYDTFIVHISSNNKNIEQFKLTDSWTEYGVTYADSLYPVDNKELEHIRNYVNVNLKKEFMHYQDITINLPINEKEFNMLDDFVSIQYMLYLDDESVDEETKNKRVEEGDIAHDHIVESFNYFDNKHNTYTDKVFYIELFKAKLSNKGKRLRNLAKLKNLNDEIHVYGFTSSSFRVVLDDDGDDYLVSTGDLNGYDLEHDETIENELFKSIVKKINNSSFGSHLGEVVNILDSNLVNIKLNNLDVIRGTDLICLGRNYAMKSGEEIDERKQALRKFIEDEKTIYKYLSAHPNHLEKVYDDLDTYIDYTSTDDWIKTTENKIDSLEINFEKIINDIKWKSTEESWTQKKFRYYLRILNVQDSIATAKITGKLLPFSYPEVGDKINLK